MCGINGVTGNRGSLLSSMNTAIVHRGPDYAGSFFDAEISLGHRLLSIRSDPERSRQPYTKPESPWVLLFNGQIYNLSDIKKLLGPAYAEEELDTIALFALIEKYGWKFTDYIHGMYAIALYHKEEKRIRLYRDPSGQKLLYYFHEPGQFAFSSEIKALLPALGHPPAVDEEGVAVASALGYIPGERTLFKNIQKLNASEYVEYHLPTGTFSRAFFKNTASGYYPAALEDTMEKLVSEHLQSKRLVALNLSGGLDSSILFYEMKRLGYSLTTYTTRFEGGSQKYNTDADLAAMLAKEYGSDHHEIRITKDMYLDRFFESYACIEEPNFNVTIPAYYITAATEGAGGDGHRAVLSGDGGDEIFGGYPQYQKTARMVRQRRLLTPWGFDALKNMRNRTRYRFGDPVERWMYFRHMPDHNSRSDADALEYLKEIAAPYLSAYRLKRGLVYETMLMDRLFWMGGENLIRSDKLYMHHSLEMRAPFAYHPLRLHLDATLTDRDYVSRTSNKLLLRRLYSGKLPEYIVGRADKTGWRSPISEWYDRPMKELFLSILREAAPSEPYLIDWQKIIARVEKSDAWPGKGVHLYLSLAILSKTFNITL